MTWLDTVLIVLYLAAYPLCRSKDYIICIAAVVLSCLIATDAIYHLITDAYYYLVIISIYLIAASKVLRLSTLVSLTLIAAINFGMVIDALIYPSTETIFWRSYEACTLLVHALIVLSCLDRRKALNRVKGFNRIFSFYCSRLLGSQFANKEARGKR